MKVKKMEKRLGYSYGLKTALYILSFIAFILSYYTLGIGCGFSLEGCSQWSFYGTLIIVAAVITVPLLVLYWLEKKNHQKAFQGVGILILIIYIVPIILMSWPFIQLSGPRPVESCDDAGDYKNQCLASVALHNRDSKICMLINDSGRKDSCYWTFAYETNSLEMCDEIENQNLTQDCERMLRR